MKLEKNKVYSFRGVSRAMYNDYIYHHTTTNGRYAVIRYSSVDKYKKTGIAKKSDLLYMCEVMPSISDLLFCKTHKKENLGNNKKRVVTSGNASLVLRIAKLEKKTNINSAIVDSANYTCSALVHSVESLEEQMKLLNDKQYMTDQSLEYVIDEKNKIKERLESNVHMIGCVNDKTDKYIDDQFYTSTNKVLIQVLYFTVGFSIAFLFVHLLINL